MDAIGYFIGFATGVISVAVIMWIFTMIFEEEKPQEEQVEDLKFPKIWELGYSTPSFFKLWIDKLFYKYILEKGNLADFIRVVPCNIDGFHLGAITITFHMVERSYKRNSNTKLKQMRHSVILKRKDVDATPIVAEERKNESLSA